ncbi:uncharacterized protein RJT20DRAFT_126528 [Scheffersomyces xylosifermentans]|uniref:uncharacterized protein n=1 Tax=Scheffersomyces xylosifermentans TaxID=1304137 RepID=UPI00315D43AE
MSIYHRYASGDHDQAFFSSQNQRRTKHGSRSKSPQYNASDLSLNNCPIKLKPLQGHFDVTVPTAEEISVDQWMTLFPKAAFFSGHDEALFHNVITIVYQNHKTKKICAKTLTKYGLSSYDNIILDSRSRFWPSCENLLPEYQKSNVRRALAITNLKNYNRISNHSGSLNIERQWDETNAGDLANTMSAMDMKSPEELGSKLLQFGLLQHHTINSLVLDVIYDNSPKTSSKEIIEENNKLVYLLGEQLEQLFDPLLEYSPEAMQISYSVPARSTFVAPIASSDEIDAVVNELITVQTNFTMGLVNLLQDFIIPLRISILGTAANTGIAKLNQVFPPTIDEITRINCILNDALAKAKRFGYVEIFKVVGLILPYFYKAFIRHEANLKNFTQKLNKFGSKYQKNIFENRNINKGKYTIREIDSVIAGSLLELPKMKLILKRLYNSIQAEKEEVRGDILDDEDVLINDSYKSAMDVIDAFGGGAAEEGATTGRSRIFTPTGKILTLLASKWPAELQYGWLTRKVVGIFELRNVKPIEGSLQDIDILIIFSDHLLFLTVIDDDYYLKRDQGKSKRLSISDVLMHSLINEKPLPKLKSLPSMEVTAWCDINEVVTSTYKSPSCDGDSMEVDFLRFLNTSANGFRSSERTQRVYSKQYEVLYGTRDAQLSGNNIIELINKSKILHKSQPFHLFKSNDPFLNVYSTAHDYSVYEAETCKSPFAMFLNITFDEPYKYFEKHPHLNLILSASFINEDRIHLVGYSRTGYLKIDEIVIAKDLQSFIKDILVKTFDVLLSTYNRVTGPLLESYKSDLAYFLEVFPAYDREELKVEVEKSEAEAPVDLTLTTTTTTTVGHSRNISELISIPEVFTQQLNGQSKKTSDDEQTAEASKPNSKKRRSFIQKMFQPFKKQQDEVPTTSTKTTSANRRLSDTFTPKGHKNKFTKVYTLSPELVEAESIVSAVPEVREISEANPVAFKRVTSGTMKVRSTQNLQEHDVVEESIQVQHIQVQDSPRPEQWQEGDQGYVQRKPSTQRPQSKLVPNKESKPQRKSLQEKRVSSEPEVMATSISENTTLPQSVPKSSTSKRQSSSGKSSLKSSLKTKYSENSETLVTAFTPPPKIDMQRKVLPMRRNVTEENVLVLDSINNRAFENPVRSNVAPYLDLKDLPVEEFYVDGESNWVSLCISRENSGLIKSNIQALKEQANIDNVINDKSAQTDENKALNIIDEGNTIDNSKEDLIENKAESKHEAAKIVDPVDLFSPDVFAKVAGKSSRKISPKLPRDDSVQSLTPSQIADEFGRTIDLEFSSSPTEDSIPYLKNAPKITHKVISQRKSRKPSPPTRYVSSKLSENYTSKQSVSRNSSSGSNYNRSRTTPSQSELLALNLRSLPNTSSLTLTSSEDEFYSPDEFANSVLHDFNRSQGMQRNSLSPESMSSDATIINELALEGRDDTVSFDMSGSKTAEATATSVTSVTNRNTYPGAITRDDSMAQLSAYLNGTINFGDFSL